MANYNLVINSKFKPFSFEEYLRPYQLYGEAYKAIEDEYANLATKANIWDEMANEQTDPYAYQTYKKYADDLKAQADILASQGLTPVSRKELRTMKNRYSRDIIPIETAYKKRQGLIDQQREALLKDNTLMFDTDYSTVSLDTLIKNPNATFTPLSGAAIAERTAKMAKEAANSIISDPEYTSVFNSQYVQQKIMQGYDISQIIAVAQRDPNAPKALLGIVDTIKDQVGYDNWSADNKIKIDSYINEGLESAIGTPKIDVMSNKGYISPLDRERLDLAREEFEYSKERDKGNKNPDGSYDKPLGGGRVLHTDPEGNTSIITGIPEKGDVNKKLSQVTRVSDMDGTGYTPVGAVVRDADGVWIGGKEGEDFPNKWRAYRVKTNLKSEGHIVPDTWFTGSGDFSYKPYDPRAEASIVTNMETIPGFIEWLNGKLEREKRSGEDEGLTNVDETTAFGQIVKQAREANISDEEFMTNNVIIVKVKGRGKKRISSDTPYDYLIYRKS